MKIFISWSGETSKEIAVTLKKWIKNVIQSIEPFVSSGDIEKRIQWSKELSAQLNDTHVGLLCVTKENFNLPWLLFEAGALSKQVDTAKVVPMLFDVKQSDLIKSPLTQFQTMGFDKQNMKKLMKELNEEVDKSIDNFDEVFEKWYPDLKEQIEKIKEQQVSKEESLPEEGEQNDANNQSETLEEILTIARDNQKLLVEAKASRGAKTDIAINRLTSDGERALRRIIGKGFVHGEYSSKAMHDIREMMYLSDVAMTEVGTANYAFLAMLGIIKDEHPIVYEMGQELYRVLTSNSEESYKNDMIKNFYRLTLKFSKSSARNNVSGNRKRNDLEMAIDALHKVSYHINAI